MLLQTLNFGLVIGIESGIFRKLKILESAVLQHFSISVLLQLFLYPESDIRFALTFCYNFLLRNPLCSDIFLNPETDLRSAPTFCYNFLLLYPLCSDKKNRLGAPGAEKFGAQNIAL